MRRILVATNGSPSARAAVAQAAELASRDGVPLDVLAVSRHRHDGGDVRPLLEAARIARDRGVDPDLHAATGTPVRAILRAIRTLRPRLLVVGSGTRSRMPSSYRPSVAREVAGQSPCPVLIVGPRPDPTPAQGGNRCSTSTRS